MLRDDLVIERTRTLPYGRRYLLAKRVLDITLCLVLTPLTVVLLAIIALAILVDTGGPIFFIQERVGQGGRRFRMYKFRTLRKDYDGAACREFMQTFVRGGIGRKHRDTSQQVYKPIDKGQITRVGRILRKTSLDELPQLFNVLLGHMSLIGPRPNVPYEVEAYHDWHYERLKALPGITGLAQVSGRSCISFDDIVRWDIEYIKQQSLQLDLKILWWTVLSVLGARGAG